LSALNIQVFFLTLTRIVLNTAVRMMYPFLAVFARGMGVDLRTMSLAMTSRALLGVFSPFLASIADNKGRKTGMMTGMLVFTLGMSLVIFSPTFLVFAIALIVFMLGKFIYDPAMQAYISDRVPYTRRGRTIAITELGWSLSFIVGIPLMGLLIARYGWQAPFPVLALAGLACTILLYRILPKDPQPADGRPHHLKNIQSVLTKPVALAGLALVGLISAANEVINLVFGVWMEDTFGLRIASLGAAAAIIGFSELGGEGLTAIFTDRLGKPRAISLGVLFNILAAISLPLLAATLPGALLGLFLFYITFEFTVVSSIPMMTEILPSARATMMAASVAGISLGRAFGALVATPIYSQGILANCLAASALNLLALASLYYLSRGMAETAPTG